MAADKAGLRELLESVRNDPSRMGRCECHELDDKILLYDALEHRNFRIRFRLATSYQDERPHTHRFSFATLILRGRYYQTLYRSDTANEDAMQLSRIQPVAVEVAEAGMACMIHHAALHSTIATPDTISLVLRGPARKTRAVIMHAETETISWRYGERDETQQRRKHVEMSLERFDWWCARLEDCGIVGTR